MRAIALRLAGPMQSWGGLAGGDDRPTLDVPTKSAVLGLVASALGIDRRDTPALHALHVRFALAVRSEHVGPVEVDFHTVDGPPQRGDHGIEVRPGIVLSQRQYLYDSDFTALLVEVEPGEPALDAIVQALRHPRWLPFLGRRACVPVDRVLIEHRAEGRAPILEADTVRALFELVPRRPRGDRSPGGGDLHIEARIAAGEGGFARQVRDALFVRGQRLFVERAVVRVPRVTEVTTTTGDEWFR